jgi:lipopolysaccharide biosynthesis glycosyltransferase
MSKNVISNRAEKINVVYSLSDGYSVYLPANIYSISINNPSNEINIFIVSIEGSEISDSNKEVIDVIANSLSNVNLKYIEVSQELIRNYKLDQVRKPLFKRDSWQHNDKAHPSDVKYLFPHLFPNLDRILYLDVDAIVVGSLGNFYFSDFNDCYLASSSMVESSSDSANRIIPFIDYDIVNDLLSSMLHNDNRILIPIKKIYFKDYICAGAMLFNLSKMRKDNFSTEFLLEIQDCLKDTVKLLEQDTFNIIFNGRIKIFDSHQLQYIYQFDEASIKNAFNKYGKLTIIHGTQDAKPWNLPRGLIFGKIFWQYQDEVNKLLKSKSCITKITYPGWFYFRKLGFETKAYTLILPSFSVAFLQKILGRSSIS